MIKFLLAEHMLFCLCMMIKMHFCLLNVDVAMQFVKRRLFKTHVNRPLQGSCSSHCG